MCSGRGTWTTTQRRKFIAGVGSLAASAAAVTGTGAFSSVQANRSVSVETHAGNQGTQPVVVYVGPASIPSSDRTTSSDFGIDPQATNRPNGDYASSDPIEGGVEDDQISILASTRTRRTRTVPTVVAPMTERRSSLSRRLNRSNSVST